MFTALRDFITRRNTAANRLTNEIAARSLELTREFGRLMETYPIEFVDAALLPANKEALRIAFKIVWFISDQQMREITGAVYLNLYRFQDGVGAVPISPELPPDADPVTTQKLLKPFLEWAHKSKAEADELYADVQDWKQNGPSPPS